MKYIIITIINQQIITVFYDSTQVIRRCTVPTILIIPFSNFKHDLEYLRLNEILQ